MKKNVLIKGILVSVVLALLTVGFTGCSGGSVYPVYSTGTVYITLDSSDDYAIYLDGVRQGYTYWSPYYTLYNVSVGYHVIEAYGYYYGYYDSDYKYVSYGSNYVYLYPW